MAEDTVFILPSPTTMNKPIKPGRKQPNRQVVYFSHADEVYVFHDNAATECRALHDVEAAQQCRYGEDVGVRQDHQSEEGRCGQFGAEDFSTKLSENSQSGGGGRGVNRCLRGHI